jgi:MinD-like ATPase involved in chromosome partitioning or flagellar assembly
VVNGLTSTGDGSQSSNTGDGPQSSKEGLGGYGAFLQPGSSLSSTQAVGEVAEPSPLPEAAVNAASEDSDSRVEGYGVLRRTEPWTSTETGADLAVDWPPVRAMTRQSRSVNGAPVNTGAIVSGAVDIPPAADSAIRRTPTNPSVTAQLPTVPPELGNLATASRVRLRSTRGWRGTLNKAGFRFGQSQAEQSEQDRYDRIRRPLPTMYQVAMVSVKGGVGRTTTAVALASVFAKLRPDRVLAVDANPHFGDLATRSVRHPYGLTLRDLVQAPDTSVFSSVLAYTATNAADLTVMASPWRSELDEPLSATEFAAAAEILRHHFNLVLVDCGTGLLDSATGRVLATSHAIVVVTSATFGGLNGAVATFGWLHAHGLQHLIARSVVVVVNQHPVKPNIDLGAVGELFQRAQRPTYMLPYDAHLAEGGPIDLRLLDPKTELALEDLAVGLIEFAPTMTEPR